jgi:hypothetical protein
MFNQIAVSGRSVDRALVKISNQRDIGTWHDEPVARRCTDHFPVLRPMGEAVPAIRRRAHGRRKLRAGMAQFIVAILSHITNSAEREVDIF